MVVRIIMPKFDDYSIYPVILSLLDFFLEREKNLFDVFQNAFGMFLTNCITCSCSIIISTLQTRFPKCCSNRNLK